MSVYMDSHGEFWFSEVGVGSVRLIEFDIVMQLSTLLVSFCLWFRTELGCEMSDDQPCGATKPEKRS